jgi:hypothetical protein
MMRLRGSSCAETLLAAAKLTMMIAAIVAARMTALTSMMLVMSDFLLRRAPLRKADLNE